MTVRLLIFEELVREFAARARGGGQHEWRDQPPPRDDDEPPTVRLPPTAEGGPADG